MILASIQSVAGWTLVTSDMLLMMMMMMMWWSEITSYQIISVSTLIISRRTPLTGFWWLALIFMEIFTTAPSSTSQQVKVTFALACEELRPLKAWGKFRKVSCSWLQSGEVFYSQVVIHHHFLKSYILFSTLNPINPWVNSDTRHWTSEHMKRRFRTVWLKSDIARSRYIWQSV